jgi:hypothetical protein
VRNTPLSLWASAHANSLTANTRPDGHDNSRTKFLKRARSVDVNLKRLGHTSLLDLGFTPNSHTPLPK